MDELEYLIEWNDKHIEVQDAFGYEFKCFTKYIEDELLESELIDFQDMEVIIEHGFEYWANEFRENALATLNELLEFNPSLKGKFNPK